MEYVPDNLDAFDSYERKEARIKRLHKKQQLEELEADDSLYPKNSSYKEEYED